MLNPPAIGAPMKRKFASLSAQEALHVAIFIEERNAEIYHRFAEMFSEFHDSNSLEVATAFWDMATEERGHGTLLQARYFERYGTSSCSMTEEDIADFIEVPRLETGTFFAEDGKPAGHSPREMALEVAALAERNAQRFYTRLAEITPDAELQTLYRELVEMEDGHSNWLDKKLAEARQGSRETRQG